MAAKKNVKKSSAVKPAVASAQQKKIALLTAENKRLKAQNAQLQQELDQYLDQWETVDGPALTLLTHLATVKSATAAAVAKATGSHIQIAETGLAYLQKLRYVQADSGKKPVYTMLSKGERYLRERGLC